MSEETKKKVRKKEEKALEKMTVKELRVMAMEIPRAVAVLDMKKGELIAFIKDARGIKDEEPVVKVEKKVIEKIKLSKSEIKAKIKQLKEEKNAAQEAFNKKRTDFLRHRISRLKKLTRRMINVN